MSASSGSHGLLRFGHIPSAINPFAMRLIVSRFSRFRPSGEPRSIGGIGPQISSIDLPRQEVTEATGVEVDDEFAFLFWGESMKNLDSGRDPIRSGLVLVVGTLLKALDKRLTTRTRLVLFFNVYICFVKRLAKAILEANTVANRRVNIRCSR